MRRSDAPAPWLGVSEDQRHRGTGSWPGPASRPEPAIRRRSACTRRDSPDESFEARNDACSAIMSPMIQHSQAAQEAYVTGGLALGLVSLKVASIDRDKVRFDLAFEHAWRRFPSRPRFPRIARSTGPDPYYQVVDDGSSRRRYLPVAVFH